MKILLTCGPASAPIDAVRRVTNQSTGELGEVLAAGLVALGHDVVCLRATAATAAAPLAPVEVVPFFDNRELLTLLEARAGGYDVVLHAAALADFEPWRVEADGLEFPAAREGKIRSAVNELVVRFRPAPKIIGRLRSLFPEAFLVGWKYEVEGDLETALDRGRHQVRENRLNGCFVNGPVCGRDFYWVRGDATPPTSVPGKHGLVEFLSKTLG